ncbi:MAG: alkaline shock response membrane anchor protein AmaP [Saccharofermentanales bacterium]
MSRIIRFALIFYAFILSIISVIAMIVVLNRNLLEAIYFVLYDIIAAVSFRWIVMVFAIFLFVFSLSILVYGLQSGRMYKTRVRNNDIGTIDIGVDAIENIVLNTAKTAQCGIKTAKARVYSTRDGKIRAELSAVIYSDIEIPAMMAKVQDKVKKDIERYTGIPVSRVIVKVSHVENVSAKVER